MRLKKGSNKEVMNKMVVSAYNSYEEKVSRTFVRPNVSKISLHSLVMGDIVEVFAENSWKIATVLKVLKGGRCLVRLDGLNHEMKVHKVKVRTRQEKLMRKIAVKKVKRVEKDCSRRHVASNSFEKVDAFAYPRYTLGNKYMQDSFNNRISEPNDLDSDRCSVGSCSVASDGHNKLSSRYDADILSTDGESNRSWDDQEVVVSIHRLELHAYRSTLEVLYASGPLSWGKEALLTNLRINLNISNDEHLTELRSLISSGDRTLDLQ